MLKSHFYPKYWLALCLYFVFFFPTLALWSRWKGALKCLYVCMYVPHFCSRSTVTMEYLHSYSVEVPVNSQGNSGVTFSFKGAALLLLHRYQCSNCAIGYCKADHSNLTVYAKILIIQKFRNPGRYPDTHTQTIHSRTQYGHFSISSWIVIIK